MLCMVCVGAATADAQRAGSSAEAQPGTSPIASLVNVTDPRFGANCGGAADPLGHRDSTCQIRAAIRFAEGARVPGAGYPVLYFPHGVYHVAGEGYASALTLAHAISIQGDGASSTVVQNTSPHGALLTYLKTDGCGDKPGPCPITVQGITLAGQGSTTTGGLVEIDSSDTGSMRNVVLSQTGGIALNLQGSSERWYFSDMEIQKSRWPVVLEGDTNEDYFQRVNVLQPGNAGDYCYGLNCPGGKLLTQGAWRSDPHSAVFLDGDNVHWTDSSIKSTESIGGMRMATTTSSVSHTYFEGFPWGGQPRVNHSIAAPGAEELGHLTRAISASDLDFPVDDANWQPLFVNDPTQARMNGTHSYVNAYGIFPSDYVWHSAEPSRAVPGITRGTMEMVQVGAFSGDGQAHLYKRGANAVAWPAGSVIEQAAPNGYGVLRIEENHINSMDPFFSARYPSGCNDTEQRTSWTSSPSEMCGEIIAGLVPDGYMVPFPTQDYVHNNFTIDVVDNSIFTGGSEQDGAGWIKIAGNATVRINQGNLPLRTFVDAATALRTYSNGTTRVQVVNWPAGTGAGTRTGSALAYVEDASAGFRFSPQEHFYSAEVMHDGTLAHQYLGSQCWYNTAQATASPDKRTCADAGGQSAPVELGRTHALDAPARFVVRDWQVNQLAPRGTSGDCQARQQNTGAVRLSTAADAALVVNIVPNPGAQVMASAAVEGDGTSMTVRVCNTGTAPARWTDPPLITVTQLP
ncbi:hypothetical protein D1Y84_12285 [Acidipila sp. EB88]|nr:hypothetical protein D1Y84_12285 [Acidipila sp. EB88]